MSILTISALDLKALSEGGEVTIVDVRTPAEFSSSWLPGSINLPLHELSAESLAVRLASEDCADCKSVYLVCASGQRARKAAEKLLGSEGPSLYVVSEGVAVLGSVGFKVLAAERQVISIERQVRIAAGAAALVGAGLVIIGTVYLINYRDSLLNYLDFNFYQI
ncbi:MAG: rhodanese-related sulfurtransferase [Halieaceae bacterium]|jgi:rhodanese-related sulfurtransferase